MTFKLTCDFFIIHVPEHGNMLPLMVLFATH